MRAGAALDIAVAGASVVGTVREHNEDYLFVGDLDTSTRIETPAPWRAEAADRGPLLVVCDGMGGVEQGGRVRAGGVGDVARDEGHARDPRSGSLRAPPAARRARREPRRARDGGARARSARHGHDAVRGRGGRRSPGDRDGRRLARVRVARGWRRRSRATSRCNERCSPPVTIRSRPRTPAARSCRRSASARTSSRRCRSSSCGAAIGCCYAAMGCTGSSAIRRSRS